MAKTPRAPQVLCLSGHDPTGGAGIQADVEACAAFGVHALTIITAHTVQDTANVQRVSAVAPILLAAQLEAVLADCAPLAIKIGLLGDVAQLPVIVHSLRDRHGPIVLDPVLRAGGGKDLASAELQSEIVRDLFPIVDVLTPNAQEARRLTGLDDVIQSGTALLAVGAKHVLITGGDEPGDTVEDLLFMPDGSVERFSARRLPETFHGAGCTLAAAIAALLAQGRDVRQAVDEARLYVGETLARALCIGQGRRIPNRFARLRS
jgi:hydroxymethylpyrimidine/phosphomethylpyrimidine kinase